MVERIALLDRDGTVLELVDYLSRAEDVALAPGAVEGLKLLREDGWRLIIVTNQSGIARGYFSEADLASVHCRMHRLLAEHGLHLDGVFYCPHGPDEGCLCRKPGAGLVWKTLDHLGCATAECVVVGDNVCDVELAEGVGAVSILVRTGHGLEAEPLCAPDAVADDLLTAAEMLVRGDVLPRLVSSPAE